MKNILLSFFFLAFCGVSLQAQSVEGDWFIDFPTPEGTTIKVKLTMKADTYEVDFGVDGSLEVTGSYIIKDGEMHITDTEGENACPGKTGVYTFSVDEKMMTMTRVSDPCEGRGGPEGVMAFSKS